MSKSSISIEQLEKEINAKHKLAFDLLYKAKRIIDLKKDMDQHNNYLVLSLIPFFICFLIITFNLNKYYPNINALFSNEKLFTKLSGFDLFILISAVITGAILY